MLDPRFKAVILASKCGSISEAANDLYLSKQAVKKQIDSLESELGITLFYRSSKGLALTPAGKLYVEGIEKLTDQYRQLVNRCIFSAKQGKKQVLTLLLPDHPKLYFERELVEYNNTHPDVLLNVVDTRNLMVLYDNMARLRTLEEGVVDVIFAPYDEQYDRETLVWQKLTDIRFYCVMKRGHPLSEKPFVTKEDLSPYQVWVNTVMDREVYEHIVDQDMEQLPERIVYAEKELFSVPIMVSFCLNDGVFINKGQFMETLKPLVAVPFEPPFYVGSGLYYRKDAPEHVMDFVDLVCANDWNYDMSGVTP